MINNQIFRWFFPKNCFGCGRWGSYLCPNCRQLIKPLRRAICPLCAQTTLAGWTHYRCRQKAGLEGLIAPFSYQSPLKELIKALKYQRIQAIADLLAELMIEQLVQSKILIYWRKNNFIFLPLPLFPLRQLWRGFNQTEIILNKICQQLSLPYCSDLLFRSRWTKEQARLPFSKRRENIVGSFRVKDSEQIKAKNFILFDDVWTTGSTLKEGAAVLRRQGANKVWALVLARRH